MSTRHQKKHTAILQAATKMFLKNGFASTSMDAIAEEAPVSKATLYKHFKDKKDLFSAAVQDRCDQILQNLSFGTAKSGTVEETLTIIAKGFMTLAYSSDALSVLRILCAEFDQFPELAQLYFDVGPKRVLLTLSKYLEQLDEKNLLHISDPVVAANFFASMLKGELFTQCLLNLKRDLSQEEISDTCREAVRIFMKAYAA